MDELNVNRMLRVIEGAWGRLGDERVVFYSRWLAQLAGDPAAIEAAILRLAETEQRLPSVATLRTAFAGISGGAIQYGNHEPGLIGQMISAIRELSVELGRSRDQDWRIPLAGVYLFELECARTAGTANDAGYHRDRAEAARRILVDEGGADHWITAARDDAREYDRMIATTGVRNVIANDPKRLESFLSRKAHLFTSEELDAFRQAAIS